MERCLIYLPVYRTTIPDALFDQHRIYYTGATVIDDVEFCPGDFILAFADFCGSADGNLVLLTLRYCPLWGVSGHRSINGVPGPVADKIAPKLAEYS